MNMAYKFKAKFDNPKTTEDASVLKGIHDPHELARRILQGATNRVLCGTSATGWFPNVSAGLADGGTGGVQIATAVTVAINGSAYVIATADNLKMPAGYLGTNTVCKFLVSTKGTSGTVTGPGNIVDKGDYADSAAGVSLAATKARLPDLPDGHCVLGMFLFHAPAAGTSLNPADFGKPSTAGTGSYTNLICMPYDA
jgi:hypothetical protein